jgi:hypothetical protein
MTHGYPGIGIIAAFGLILFLWIVFEILLHRYPGLFDLDEDGKPLKEVKEVLPTDRSLREYMMEQDRAYLRKQHEEGE